MYKEYKKNNQMNYLKKLSKNSKQAFGQQLLSQRLNTSSGNIHTNVKDSLNTSKQYNIQYAKQQSRNEGTR